MLWLNYMDCLWPGAGSNDMDVGIRSELSGVYGKEALIVMDVLALAALRYEMIQPFLVFF